jgi:hypothetical protein
MAFINMLFLHLALAQTPPSADPLAQFGAVFADLYPGLMSEKLYKKAEIEKLAKQLAEGGLAAANHKTDPSLNSVVEFLGKQAKAVAAAPDSVEGRKKLMSGLQFCVSCHPKAGAEAGKWPQPAGFADFSNLDKANYLAVTRDYSEAVKHYELALADKSWAKSDPEGWQAAAVRLLAIVVRAENSPRLALELVSKIRDDAMDPSDVRKYSIQWRTDIKKWLDEGKTSSGKLAKAQALLADGEKRTPAEAGFVPLLRASRLAQANLDAGAKGDELAETLLIAGDAGSRLAALDLDSLHPSYYIWCLAHAPKSKFAATCKERLMSRGVSEADIPVIK